MYIVLVKEVNNMDQLCQLLHKIEFISTNSGILTWYCLNCDKEIQEMEDVSL